MATTIPTYALYGEQSGLSWENFFNVEMISLRSKDLNWRASPHVHDSLIQVLFIQRGQVEVLMNCTRQLAKAPLSDSGPRADCSRVFTTRQIPNGLTHYGFAAAA